MARKIILGIISFIIVVVVLSATFFVVTQRDQVVITRLGEPKRVEREPGLGVRAPFVDRVNRFDRRLLEYDSSPREILTRDKKNLLVDNYARWQIVEPLKFLQTVRDEEGAQSRLDDIIYSELRIELGRHDFLEIVATARQELMDKVLAASRQKARAYGIELVDVRIKRADLPPENANAVFGRMRAEREREAMRYRSEGNEEAAKIRAEADKERVILLADAYEQEQSVRGEGDAEAIRIYADSYGRDPNFYAFIRSLEAYRASLKEGTTLILSSESEFLRYLNNPSGAASPAPDRVGPPEE